jgi:outer membrane protein
MNASFDRSRLYLLIFLICAVVLLAMAVKIAQAQEFQFITLKDAIDIALENNIELQRSSNQVASSAISLRQSKAAFFPDLSASASASQGYSRGYDPMTDVTQNRESHSLNLGLSTRLTVFDGFGNIASLQNARRQLLANEKSLLHVKDSVIFETFSGYLQVLMDEELLASEHENLTAQRQQLERIEEFYKVGNRSLADLLQQQAEVSQAELRALRAEEYLNVSKLQLLRTIGLPSSTDFEVEIMPVENLVGELAGEAVDVQWVTALQNRTDISAQTLSVEAAEKGIKAARSGYWPALSLSAQVGSGYSSSYEYGNFSDQILDINPDARIGLSLSIPIFDRSVTRSSVQRTRIQLANEQLNLEDLRQTVSFEVQQALFDYSTAQKELEAARAQREFSRQALEVTRKRYDVGSAILAELSLARAQYVAANNDWIQANYQLLISRVALDYYNGKLDSCPLIPL